MRNHHAIQRASRLQHYGIFGTLQTRCKNIKHVAASRPQEGNDVRMNVFVRQKRKILKFHDTASAERNTSFFRK